MWEAKNVGRPVASRLGLMRPNVFRILISSHSESDVRYSMVVTH